MLQYLINSGRLVLGLTPGPVHSRRIAHLDSENFYYLTASGRIRGRGSKIQSELLQRTDIRELIAIESHVLVLASGGELYDGRNGKLLKQRVQEVRSNTNDILISRGHRKSDYAYQGYNCSVKIQKGKVMMIDKSNTEVEPFLPPPHNYFRCNQHRGLTFHFYRLDGSVEILPDLHSPSTPLRLGSPIIDVHRYDSGYLAVLADGRVHDSRTDSEQSWKEGRVIALAVAPCGTRYTVLLDNDELRVIS